MAAISEAKKKDVLTFLLGWAKKTVDKRIEQGRPAVITWEDFHKALVSAAKKFDRAENVLVAGPVEVTEAELQKELRDRTYVRQLEIVQCDDDDMVRAVNDYLRSATHRTTWSEDGDVMNSRAALIGRGRANDRWSTSRRRSWAMQNAGGCSTGSANSSRFPFRAWTFLTSLCRAASTRWPTRWASAGIRAS